MATGLVLLCVSFYSSKVRAKSELQSFKDKPIVIEAHSAAFFKKLKQWRFRGDAVAKQGNLTVQSEEIDAVSADTTKASIQSLIARKNVRLLDRGRRGFGDRLDYDRAQGIIILTGNPKLLEEGSEIYGDRIESYLVEDRVNVQRPRGRMKAGKKKTAKAAASKQEKLFSKDEPVDIEAETATFLNQKRKGEFRDNVVAKQGSITIECEELDVFYKKGAKKSIDTLVARKNVRLHKKNRRGFGERLDYDSRKGILILTGNPKLVEGDSVMHGQRIKFYVDDDRVEVQRARGRMRVTEKENQK
jgi:lipopolysaccharide transport protein LptA